MNLEKRKPRPKREEEYERAYVKRVEKEGAMCPKLVATAQPGYPDRLELRGIEPAARILKDTFHLSDEAARMMAKTLIASAVKFIEFKAPNGRLRPRQRVIIGRLRCMGYCVEIRRGDEVSDEAVPLPLPEVPSP